MGFSKVQIDARLALQSLASPRSRRAVYAPSEALYYRYEGRQFFDLDFPTFAGLFAALTRHQLSTVAKATEVIEPENWSRTTLDDSWSRLYREGRKSKPVLAALSLVGTVELFPCRDGKLTTLEAAHHALTEALEAQDSPPQEVIETCNDHVQWLKDILCRPDSRIVGLSAAATKSSHGSLDDLSRKRSLSDTSDPGDVQCRKKRANPVQIRQDDADCETSSIAVTRHSKDHGESSPITKPADLKMVQSIQP